MRPGPVKVKGRRSSIVTSAGVPDGPNTYYGTSCMLRLQQMNARTHACTHARTHARTCACTHTHTHRHTQHILCKTWRESNCMRMSLNMPSIVESHAQTGNHAFSKPRLELAGGLHSHIYTRITIMRASLAALRAASCARYY